MLDLFLILGQIPGTSYQLTFSDTMFIALALVTVLYWKYRAGAPEPKHRPLIWESLVRYEQPELKLPAEPIRPKASAPPANTWLTWLNRHWRTIR